MGGKSNKFDFSNRSTSGTKLGGSIASTLIKDAEKLQKDAAKAAEKSRKASIGSNSGSISGSTDTGEQRLEHHIDLQAPAKALGDDGLAALAGGLEQTLRSGTDTAALRLQHLNLSTNGLTTASLARLAPIIELAKYDLKTLDLPNNAIKVVTDEEASEWEVFLRSIASSSKLHRLDLSDNGELGTRGIEILARVYAREKNITALPVHPLPADGSDDTEGPLDHTNGVDQSDDRGCGLRSIPYITLHQIGINDAGALWLSYVLEGHSFPDEVIKHLEAMAATSSTGIQQQATKAHGLDWDNNASTLGKDGVFLLQKAESVRLKRFLEEHDFTNGTAGDTPVTDEPQAIRRSFDRRPSRAAAGMRRTSLRSSNPVDGDASELDSARKKIQRHIIEQDMRQEKSSSVDLWRAALEVVSLTRMLFIASPGVDISCVWANYTGEALFSMPPSEPSATPSPVQVTSQARGKENKLSIDTAKASHSTKGSYAAKLVAIPGTPNEPSSIAITEVTNTPTTPRMVQLKPHRKGGFSEGTDIPAVTEKLQGLIVRDDSPQRFIKYQMDRIKTAGGRAAFRDVSVPSHLPTAMVERILGFAFGGVPFAVLSEKQMGAAISWGQRRDTLTYKPEYRGKDNSFKQWVVLNDIGCLAYDK